MKKYITPAVAITLFSTSLFAEHIPECAQVDKSKIESLFDDWNRTLQTGDAQKVSEQYLDGAVLLPTLSNQTRLSSAEIVDYFEHFLAKKPVGKIDSRTIFIGCNMAIDAGNYTFKFKDDSRVSARYTFTYAWNGSAWKISTHHSSLMPEK